MLSDEQLDTLEWARNFIDYYEKRHKKGKYAEKAISPLEGDTEEIPDLPLPL